jgi:hypothetical protein
MRIPGTTVPHRNCFPRNKTRRTRLCRRITAAIERLATAPTNQGLVIGDIWLLRLRALLARAHGDAAAYTHVRDGYRDLARMLEFEGHIAWAEAMP